MSPIELPWTRLVRYTSSASSPIKYGEPILTTGGDVGQLAKEGKLQVTQLSGSDPFQLKKTDVTEKVFRLYGPLETKDVPLIRCIGLNYKTHILETGRPLPTCPTVFTKPGPAVADHDAPVPIPRIAQEQCDYEGELVIVIGRDGKNISAENALDYIAGYTVGNDVSARDWQREAGKAGPVPQWSFSKSFDKYAPLGPCMVRQDLLNDAGTLYLRTSVNGEIRQESHTSDLCFGVRKLVEFCSQGQTLQKGSLIMTGTPGGVGLFMKPPNFLKDGDEATVEIENIGTLRNTMAFEKCP
ncbi:hypothetical protein FE257_003302 [Aspergillus nanangensis]|uniref:Fumarylacetoacetase-like C-terminal domain-containing protein n=1 Tax=Aspergillus nanangensis TaxID=2582783 RepID=A0AAD4CSW0_ASPNN|nr:hypothetical protein FE257_003302 [Aspergillus nanangensis]